MCRREYRFLPCPIHRLLLFLPCPFRRPLLLSHSHSPIALSVSSGGIGQPSLPAHALLLGAGTDPIASLATGSVSDMLVGGPSGPQWVSKSSTVVTSLTGTPNGISVSSATGDVTLSLASHINVTSLTLTGSSVNQLLVGGGAFGPLTSLPVGASYQVLTGGATPSWMNISSIADISILGTTNEIVVTTVDGVATLSLSPSVTIDSLTLTNALPIASGGTQLSSFTPYELVVGSSSNGLAQLSVGATGTVLSGNSGAMPSFTTSPSLTALTLSTPLPVASGGTNVTSFTPNELVIGSGSNGLTQLSVGSTGTVLSGTTGGAPTWATPVSLGLISSVAGTVNQIAVSTTGGTATISLVSDVAISSSLSVASLALNATAVTATTGNLALSSSTGSLNVHAGGGDLTLSTSGSIVVTQTVYLTGAGLYFGNPGDAHNYIYYDSGTNGLYFDASAGFKWHSAASGDMATLTSNGLCASTQFCVGNMILTNTDLHLQADARLSVISDGNLFLQATGDDVRILSSLGPSTIYLQSDQSGYGVAVGYNNKQFAELSVWAGQYSAFAVSIANGTIVVSGSASGNTYTLTTGSAHGIQVGQTISVSGVVTTSAPAWAYQGWFVVSSVPSTTTFSYVGLYTNPNPVSNTIGYVQVFTGVTTVRAVLDDGRGNAAFQTVAVGNSLVVNQHGVSQQGASATLILQSNTDAQFYTTNGQLSIWSSASEWVRMQQGNNGIGVDMGYQSTTFEQFVVYQNTEAIFVVQSSPSVYVKTLHNVLDDGSGNTQVQALSIGLGTTPTIPLDVSWQLANPGVGRKILARFNNPDACFNCSEAAIVLSQTQNYFQGISGAYNSGNPALIISVADTAHASTWQPMAGFFANGAMTVGRTDPYAYPSSYSDCLFVNNHTAYCDWEIAATNGDYHIQAQGGSVKIGSATTDYVYLQNDNGGLGVICGAASSNFEFFSVYDTWTSVFKVSVRPTFSVTTLHTTLDDGSGNAAFASISLSTPLSVGNGGTGASYYYPNALLVGGATGAISTISTGTAGYVLQSNGGSPPSWTTTPDLASVSTGELVTGDLIFYNGDYSVRFVAAYQQMSYSVIWPTSSTSTLKSIMYIDSVDTISNPSSYFMYTTWGTVADLGAVTSVVGTSNQVTASPSGSVVTVGLASDVQVSSSVTAGGNVRIDGSSLTSLAGGLNIRAAINTVISAGNVVFIESSPGQTTYIDDNNSAGFVTIGWANPNLLESIIYNGETAAFTVYAGSSYTVVSGSASGTTYTLNTATAHSLTVGQTITITNVDTTSSPTSAYNGWSVVTAVPSSTSFSYVGAYSNPSPVSNSVGFVKSYGGVSTLRNTLDDGVGNAYMTSLKLGQNLLVNGGGISTGGSDLGISAAWNLNLQSGTGNIEMLSDVYLNNHHLYVKTGDVNHFVGYNATVDGLGFQAFVGFLWNSVAYGQLGQLDQNGLAVNKVITGNVAMSNSGISSSGSLTLTAIGSIVMGQTTYMSGNGLYMTTPGDAHNYIFYDAGTQGILFDATVGFKWTAGTGGQLATLTAGGLTLPSAATIYAGTMFMNTYGLTQSSTSTSFEIVSNSGISVAANSGPITLSATQGVQMNTDLHLSQYKLNWKVFGDLGTYSTYDAGSGLDGMLFAPYSSARWIFVSQSNSEFMRLNSNGLSVGPKLIVGANVGTDTLAGNYAYGSIYPIFASTSPSTTTGPTYLAIFDCQDGGGTTSEARIAFSQGKNFYQGIAGAYNNGAQYMDFSVSNPANAWAPVARMWTNGAMTVGTSQSTTPPADVGSLTLAVSQGSLQLIPYSHVSYDAIIQSTLDLRVGSANSAVRIYSAVGSGVYIQPDTYGSTVEFGTNSPGFTWFAVKFGSSVALSVTSGAGINFASGTASGYTYTIVTTTAHGYQVGQWISVTNCNPADYNGFFWVSSVPSSTSFTYTGGTNNPGNIIGNGFSKLYVGVGTARTTLDDGLGNSKFNYVTAYQGLVLPGATSGSLTITAPNSLTSQTWVAPTSLPSTNQVLTAVSVSSSIVTLGWSSVTSSIKVDVQTYSTAGSYTWTRPSSNIVSIQLILIGGGGGGGAGMSVSCPTNAQAQNLDPSVGAGGGQPGMLITVNLKNPSMTQTTYPVNVGAGGAGGLPGSGGWTANNGTSGGDSWFGSSSDMSHFFTAKGGNFGWAPQCGTTIAPPTPWGAYLDLWTIPTCTSTNGMGSYSPATINGVSCGPAPGGGGGGIANTLVSVSGSGGSLYTTNGVLPTISGGAGVATGNGFDGVSSGLEGYFFAGSGGSGGGQPVIYVASCNGGNGGLYGGGGGGAGSTRYNVGTACIHANGGNGGGGFVRVVTLYV